ncbi:MAG: adenylate/guanylate cyclase domain-containing protein, partial [Chthoniobacterales bacterium]
MAPEAEDNLRFEIGHVLFLDVVGYSKLVIDEQKEQMRRLTSIVLATRQVQDATNEQLVRLPTGDGMALVFRNSLEEPAQCALEIARALQAHPDIRVRMGIHSGSVTEMSDVNERTNIAGAGINLAQRVMDCGDAGHILLSKRVADDLENYARWQPFLHDLGDAEVKHGVQVRLVNFYGDEFGNPARPAKLKESERRSRGRAKRIRNLAISAGLVLFATLAGATWWLRSDPTAKSQNSSAPPISEKSIAVLPFENASNHADTEYLSDGMTETLISSLSQLPKLNVKARASVFRYKGQGTSPAQIAKELNVQTILTGRVVQRGNELSLYIELVDVALDKVMWSQQYNRKQADLVTLQSEIARDVSQKLNTKLSGAEQQRLANNYTENAEAYKLYLKGRFYANKGTPQDIRKAIEYYQQAIAVDPNYAVPFAGLADGYTSLSSFEGASPHEAMPKAKEAALKALSLGDDLAEAHTSLGNIFSTYYYDFVGAEREFQRAIELNPQYARAHHGYGLLLTRLGRQEESFAQFRRGLEIEPLSSFINKNYGESLFFARRYEESVAQFKKTLELDANFAPAHDALGFA